MPLKQVTVDGANGVGAVKSLQLSKHLSDYLHITTIYDGSEGILNHQVGLFVSYPQSFFAFPCILYRVHSVKGLSARV